MAAARQLLAGRGLSITMEDVASQAGVGVGTIYRGFGSKQALIDALVAESIERVEAEIAACVAAPTGWQGLQQVFRRYVQLQVEDRAFHELLLRPPVVVSQMLRARVAPLLEDVVERAKSEGAVRADLAAIDVPVLTHAIASGINPASPLSRRVARRHVELLLKGIAAGPDTVPVPEPLLDEEFPGWMEAATGHPLPVTDGTEGEDRS